MLCKHCKVELDADMEVCPLCGTPVNGYSEPKKKDMALKDSKLKGEEKHLLQKILWQVTSILLLSAILATLAIDLAIHGYITWSIYPVTICTIVLLYASFFALFHRRLILKISGGWLSAAVFLLGLYYLAINLDWTAKVALPILSTVNIIAILLTACIRLTKRKGLNIVAYLFIAIALVCMGIEAIINYYYLKRLYIQWSIIVSACLLPVTAALLFMYLRTRRNADLQKIFHT